ncbi:thioredoxin [Coralliovum pocilloporae]|uniref:thioredoxin n=1 Tax=Coralliovum pocilloporae TaxID=3066369 RepID=UPI003D9C5D12
MGGQYGGTQFGSEQPSSAPAGDLIKDATTQSFVQDVMEESKNQPVLVDFWAPWCGPCRQLTPAIEAAVTAARGAVKLVKMNIDEHPEIPGQMGIQSIPAVVAFKDGRPADGFMGAQSETQVTAFIEKLVGPIGPSDSEQALEAARMALGEKNLQVAAQLCAQVLQTEADNVTALAILAQCYVEAGDLDQAEATLDQVADEKASDADVVSARAALTLARQAADLGDTAELHAALEADPSNHQARFDLALALNAREDREGAIAELITIIKADREWNEDGARKQLLQFFEAWGMTDKATILGRRKLSAVLFS